MASRGFRSSLSFVDFGFLIHYAHSDVRILTMSENLEEATGMRTQSPARIGRHRRVMAIAFSAVVVATACQATPPASSPTGAASPGASAPAQSRTPTGSLTAVVTEFG